MIKIKRPFFLFLIVLSFVVVGGICLLVGGVYGYYRGSYDSIINNSIIETTVNPFILTNLRKGKTDVAINMLEIRLTSAFAFLESDTLHKRFFFGLNTSIIDKDNYLVPASYYLNKYPRNILPKSNESTISDSLRKSISVKTYRFIKRYSSKADTFQFKKGLIRQIDSLPPDSITLEQVLGK